MSESSKAGLDHPPVSIAGLEAFISSALEAVGIPAEDATQVAALMAEADARGGDAHGVFRLPQYVTQIETGGINARPNIRIVNDRPGVALIDGNNGLGHLVMKGLRNLRSRKRARRASAG